MIDKDEYPQTAELELRCVNMLSRLWHSPSDEQAIGCSTVSTGIFGFLHHSQGTIQSTRRRA